MLEKISTPISIAILIYHSYQYYTQWKLEQSLEMHKIMRNNEKIIDQKVPTTKFKKPEIIKVADEIYVAVGYALANSIMIVGESGVIIIDTTESVEATKTISAEFKKITNKPLKGIVYTHNHA